MLNMHIDFIDASAIVPREQNRSMSIALVMRNELALYANWSASREMVLLTRKILV